MGRCCRRTAGAGREAPIAGSGARGGADFVYGGWESNFAADGAGERATLAELGIASYVSPAACRSIKLAKLTFDELFAETAEIGTIFDAADAASVLIAEQKAETGCHCTDSGAHGTLVFFGVPRRPIFGAGSNAPAMMMETLGLQNIMASVDDGWIAASWEAVVDANPDVIVLVDAAWNSAEQKKKLLAENPITSQLDAVVNQRYLTVPFPASEAGVRNVSATADMAAQLASLSLTP